MMKEEGTSSAASSPLKFLSQLSPSPAVPWLREPRSEERGLYLIKLLLSCVNHITNRDIQNANMVLEEITLYISTDGDSMQRMVSYFSKALADRVIKGWSGFYKALNSTKKVSVSEGNYIQRLFFELCPFLKISYLVTNQAIFEAMEGEKIVHIIDLNLSNPAQMIDLLQTLSARPEGPPHLKITGVHKHKEVLDQMALRLTEEAEKLDIAFQFNAIVSDLENLDIESLRVKTGEALAVSSVLQLHSLLATDQEDWIASRAVTPAKLSLSNHRPLKEMLGKDPLSLLNRSPDSALSPLSTPKMGSFLSNLCNLSPKVMVITEQESNNNGFSLMDRVTEALFFYGALFDCLESTVPRGSAERQKVEEMLFGEEIKNIVACEGVERTERHEKLDKWILRLELAGFARLPLSYQAMMQATRLLRQSHVFGDYRLIEENGSLFICRKDRPLFSVSAWRFCR